MNFLKSMYRYRNEIGFLSVQTVKKQYAGTIFGPIWAVAQPFVYMIVFYFFYKFGIRFTDDVDGHPFVLYIFAGNISWLYMSQSFVQGSKIFITNSVLVKTIKFPSMALPLIDVLAKTYVHLAAFALMLVYFFISGYYPTWSYLNLLFYLPMSVLFLTNASFLLGTLSVVLRDIPAFIQSITMPLFWATPIIWPISGDTMIFVERLINPFYFFVEGYRKTLLYDKFFWQDISGNGNDILYIVYFVVANLVVLFLSVKLYNKFKPIMADFL